jgi:hypothetical protein
MHRWSALALVLALGGPLASIQAQEPLRLTRGIAGDAKPIQFAADNVSSWSEDGEQVFLLRGRVLIEQGLLQIRAQQAVLWVDADRQKRTGRFAVALVADGGVQIEHELRRDTAATAIADLVTKQTVKVRPGISVSESPQGGDPFIQRARTLRTKRGTEIVSARQPPPSFPDEPGGTSQPPPGLPSPGTPLPTIPVPGTPAPMPALPPTPAAPPGPPRTISIAPRSANNYNVASDVLPGTGERVTLLSGGVIVTIRNVAKVGLVDIEADRLVFWSRGKDGSDVLDKMRTPEGQTTQDVEFYMEGNVELRSSAQIGTKGQEQRTLRAERVYYDVQRNVAVAVNADLELKRPGLPDALHLKAEELLQIAPTKFEATKSEIFSSRLPSDPGLKLVTATATVEQRTIERRTIFGQPVIDSKTGQPQTYTEELVHGDNVFLRLEDVPIFYVPFIQGDARDPLGPLQNFGFKQDRIFGTQVYTTFDVWNILKRPPLPGTHWSLEADYLSRRGPALGTFYTFEGRDLFGLDGPYSGLARLYGMHDMGTDILGGGRGPEDHHPDWRGRALFREQQKIFDDFTFQTQVSLLSDKNFLEQYYKTEFDTDPNQETFLYLREERNIWSWSLWAKPRIRDWVTETEWLPRADGAVTGFSFLNVNDRPIFTYNAIASAGYAQLKVTDKPPPPIYSTDVDDSLGRFDLRQELSLPTYIGPVRVVPYGVLELTDYTNNLNGENDGRLYGGGGVRASLPMTRLYPNIQSELFNLNGINHKIVFSGNYFIAHSSDPYTDFPLLDRLDDDATDQALRDITPRQPFLNPANGVALKDSPIYNPQLYAIRRLVDSSVDTLDTIEVLQMDVRQRWQTKRGFPGQEHIVDYFTLDLSASLFPHPQRDNFGSNVGFLEYDAIWNVGDRTALTSTGWVDPFNDGARVFTLGAFLNRTDRTNFFVGYRYIDPVDSRALTVASTYIFSPKYGVTASTTYDFGIQQALSNSLVISRIGSDLTMNIGFTYNAILNNFGFTFEILPNLLAMGRQPGTGLFGGRGPTR